MSTPPADLDCTAVITGDWLPGYEVLSVLGSGGFGTVVKARQLKLDRVVAVKVIQLDPAVDSEVASRFASEAVTLGKFHHPNIVQVYDFGFHEGRLFIAMELLEGEDLGQRLKREGKLDERMVWTIARQTASSLAHAAELGVVHRDVKPANLFLVPPPTGLGLPRDIPMVKVTDFGLALTKNAVQPTHQKLGPVIGTPAYMAPEQYRGATDLDHRADIYALGATVFHALAGRPPFEGPTVWDVMVQKLDHTPKFWPAACPQALKLLAAMMATDPNQRIGSYEELIERIDQLSVLAEQTAPSAKPRRPKARKRRMVWTVAATLLIAISGATIGLTRGRQPGVYESTGYHELLFQAGSLAGWLPPSAGGMRTIEQDVEHVPILSFNGFIRRAFTPQDNYRVTLGVDLFEAKTVEVHFAFPEQSTDAGRRLVIRISKAGGAILGSKEGDQGAFHPLAEPVPFPDAAWFDGRGPYLEVRFDRAGDSWLATFNGKSAGRVADDGKRKAPEIRVNAEGGRARIDTAVLERLERKTDLP